MKIDPNHLQMLAAIIDSGGLSEGAAQLNKSQPSVSRSLAMLEKRLGSRLFEKGKRPLRPTELCQTLAEQGRVIGAASAAAQTAVELYSGGKAGTARIAGTPIFMDGVISNMMASFQSAFPEVAIHQTYGYLADLSDQLSVGNIDLAICPVSPEGVPPPLKFRPILRGRNVIACASSHPLARQSAVKLEDIAAYPWIAPPAGSPLYSDLKAALDSIGITDFRVSFTGGSLASILSVMAGSDALTVLPYSVVFMQRAAKTITALPVRLEHPDRELGLLWHEDRPMRPAVRRFQKFLEAEFKGLADRIDERGRENVWRR
ncbi:LysR family transcriptional regulator [Yoonia litorea]|uniref:DNA-binding transcriptional regulator, LysR family n=1 Tax=Yoonia litorea TaxID=1123755 RepID=A0A1I6ML41_9RHOB|nr:LysR family transcriptional regulator [Yoonia litorea]SFS16361.1 DNA-binding transcriptional regulator, LysR family [Yoonia litorea]